MIDGDASESTCGHERREIACISLLPHGTLPGMMALLRALPNALWWVTVFFATLAFFTQLAIMIGRSGAVALWMLLVEFIVTLAILALPVALAWRARQRQSLWYAAGALVLLIAFARIFFL